MSSSTFVVQAVYTEFDRLRRTKPQGPLTAAHAADNDKRNRYSNVMPFDANRVRLQASEYDYINASLLESPQEELPAWCYVATQVRHQCLCNMSISAFWTMEMC